METAAAFTLLSTLLIFYGILQVEAIESAACDSAIYCQPGEGSLLHTVQMARLYKDSKTFVDKPLKFEEDEVLENFNNMMAVSMVIKLTNYWCFFTDVFSLQYIQSWGCKLQPTIAHSSDFHTSCVIYDFHFYLSLYGQFLTTDG